MLPIRLAHLNSKHRRRQTEIQRAVAEAELDLCTATANTLDSSSFGLAEASAEDAMKAGERIIGQSGDSTIAAVGGFAEATETVSLDEIRGDRRDTAIEPGEVPV